MRTTQTERALIWTIRLGYTLSLVRFGGHFGFNVKSEWRGHHYAGKACKLLRQIAITYGMDVLWITCNPNNWPSRKTCEWIGATLVEIVDLPPENDQYKEGRSVGTDGFFTERESSGYRKSP